MEGFQASVQCSLLNQAHPGEEGNGNCPLPCQAWCRVCLIHNYHLSREAPRQGSGLLRAQGKRWARDLRARCREQGWGLETPKNPDSGVLSSPGHFLPLPVLTPLLPSGPLRMGRRICRLRFKSRNWESEGSGIGAAVDTSHVALNKTLVEPCCSWEMGDSDANLPGSSKASNVLSPEKAWHQASQEPETHQAGAGAISGHKHFSPRADCQGPAWVRATPSEELRGDVA